MSPLYVDTSALAKWYIAERGSEEFEGFIRDYPGALISRLSIVEMRGLLARKRRNREISPQVEGNVFRTFEDDIRQGHLSVRSLADNTFYRAIGLIDRIRAVSLRALDALHLSVAVESEAAILATADQNMAEAARETGLTARLF